MPGLKSPLCLCSSGLVHIMTTQLQDSYKYVTASAGSRQRLLITGYIIFLFCSPGNPTIMNMGSFWSLGDALASLEACPTSKRNRPSHQHALLCHWARICNCNALPPWNSIAVVTPILHAQQVRIHRFLINYSNFSGSLIVVILTANSTEKNAEAMILTYWRW